MVTKLPWNQCSYCLSYGLYKDEWPYWVERLPLPSNKAVEDTVQNQFQPFQKLQKIPKDDDIRLVGIVRYEVGQHRLGTILLAPPHQETVVLIYVGNWPEEFAIDTTLGPIPVDIVAIVGATANRMCIPFLFPQTCNSGFHEVIHEFLYIPTVLWL